MGHRSWLEAWLTLALAAWSLVACGAATAARKGDGRRAVAARDTRIQHEECPIEEGGAQVEDVNGDGRPDRTTVADGQMARCRALDFNFDGTMDAWVYFDETENIRRRENDFDRDGRVDEISLYRAGELSEQHRATTLAGKLDTWHYYSAGKVQRTERDSNGDDYVDQWWEYPADRSGDCPLIHSDVDGDGRPDPGATVDVCRDQYVPAPRDGAEKAAAGAARDSLEEVPTEVETDAEGAEEPATSADPGGGAPAPSDPEREP